MSDDVVPPAPRVLLVEDNLDLRDLLEAQLKFAGYVVVTATDGMEALNALATEHPDIVLTDVLMPKLRGTDLARRMRGTPEYAATPVVLFTGVGVDDDDLRAALLLPGVRVLQKGGPARELVAIIAQLTSRIPAS